VAVYGALDLVVSASTSEGLSNVLGEALACGVPCIATDVGDSARVVDDADRVVPPGDAGALAEAVLRQLDEAPELPVPALRAAVEQRYGVEAMIMGTEHVLTDLAASGSVRHGARGEGGAP